MSDLNINKDSETKADTTTVSETSPQDLVTVIDDLLNQLSSRFTNMSSDLIAKMDEMSRRLDNLESTIQANASKPAAEESK